MHFRFEEMWLKNEGYEEVVKEGWSWAVRGVKFFQEEDCNTKWFHKKASNRRRKNFIKGLRDEGILPNALQTVLNAIVPCVTSAMNEDLLAPVIVEEIVGGDVVEVVCLFFESKDECFTHVVLIPKVKELQDMTQLCPISLCNVLYKICAKASSLSSEGGAYRGLWQAIWKVCVLQKLR
ncbi:hypothetical protein ACFX2F_028112 [Malus domestica]